jgi:RND family efflux transporter MFP subunit
MTATIHARAHLAIFALAAATGCGGAPPEQTPAEPSITRLDAIDVDTVRSERIRSGPRIAGTIEPRVRSVVRAEVGGSVLDVRAELGQPVEAGDLLARIEARTLREAFQSSDAALRAAREELRVAETELERVEALAARGTLAARERETAHSRVEAARAQVSAALSGRVSARNAVGDATIDAPITGVISEDAVDAGDVVAPGTHLFTVIDPNSMRLEASVPSSSLGALSIGTPVEFEVRGYPGREFAGTIERIAPVADPITRQITILVGIPNEGGELIAGLFAQGRVVAEQR